MAQQASKDLTFLWEGTDRRGVRVKGETTGSTVSLIKAQLRRQGINPLKVKKKPKPLFGSKQKKIKPADIAVFSRQMATMMGAGVPLVQSFDIIGRGHDNPGMQELIMSIKSDVESGGTLAEALGKHPRYFDALFCNLIHAGEQAGILESLLNKIAMYKEKTEAIKGKIKKAMYYPAAVIIAAFIVSGILLYYVVPQFASLFNNFGANLPTMTLMVVHLSNFVQAWWWAIILGASGSVYGIIELKRRVPAVQEFIDRMVLKLPVMGPIMTKAVIARFARTLSTMFAAGVPLVEAMETVAGTSGNVVYRDAVLRMRDDVSTGITLNSSMREANVFPNMVIQMVAIGEEAGSIDSMLSKVADFYEEEVDNAVDGLSSLLEPLIMAVLGVIIGGLVIAMYLPIFKMGSVV